MQIAVILPAAGLSRRFNSNTQGPSKIELDLAGRPVFLRALQLFLGRAEVCQVILAVNPDALDDFQFRYGDKLAFHHVDIVAGGREERWQTVLNALDSVREGCTHVAVHDAARPLASDTLIERVFAAAQRHDAVIPALPVSSTLKRAGDEIAPPADDPVDAILGGGATAVAPVLRRVAETVPRAGLYEVQTPQVFKLDLLRGAYGAVREGKVDPAGVTDDASLVEALGEEVAMVEGESTNLKITRPADAELAAAILEHREKKDAAATARKRLFGDDDED